MICIRHFGLGLSGRRVDWATRHHSRCYDAGAFITFSAIVLLPFVASFAAGFIAGLLAR